MHINLFINPNNHLNYVESHAMKKGNRCNELFPEFCQTINYASGFASLTRINCLTKKTNQIYEKQFS